MSTVLYDYTDFEDCGLYIGSSGTLSLSTAKRVKNIYPLFYDPENIALATHNAEKGKGRRTEIDKFNKHYSENMDKLYLMLRDETFETGKYKVVIIHDPKERELMIAPFFPDRIVHQCVINVLGQLWCSVFISSTYACIKGRGITKCMEDVHKALVLDRKGTKYCLKIDIRKFYDNVDHAALKQIIRRTIADARTLRLLDKIIDSNGKSKGLPIGNYTSQYLANLYLAYFDHFMKEEMGAKYYYRYMDDIVLLSDSKEWLHQMLDAMALYLGAELKVYIKKNWQIYPVDARGIDYVGFKQNHYGILLRKGILLRFYKKLNGILRKYDIQNEDDFKHLFPSEYGWIIRCSEEHSNFIFNKCLKNGKPNYRIAV